MGAQAGSDRRVIVIGVGNEYRGDDAVGLLVARRLKGQLAESVTVVEASGEGVALMHAWHGADAVVLVDAVRSGLEPGTLHRLEAHAQPVAAELFHRSTHAVGVSEAIELARALGELPPQVTLYGIEGKSFDAGKGLSLEAERAAYEVAEQVLRQVGRSARAAAP